MRLPQAQRPLRILQSSNTIYGVTGYSNQSKLFLPRWAAMGHQVAQFAWYGLEGGIISAGMEYDGQTYPIRLYPKYRDAYGSDVVAAHAQHWEADVIITLIDAWVLNPETHKASGALWAPWAPVDMEPLAPPLLRVLREADQPIVYSRFGERMAQDAGLDVRYVPHGVDTIKFSPGDLAEARDKLRWPKDRFIVGMVAANKGTPSRKSYPEHLAAFECFARKHTDALIYLHTNKGVQDGMGGVNLPELCDFLGISDRVLWADEYQQIVGFPDDYMVSVYRALDVLLSASRGEGFGIPILEAQACGCPVIVGDWTSMSELCFGGWKLPRPGVRVDGYGWIEQADYTPLAAYQTIPMIGDILEALERAYQVGGGDDREAARRGALAYDADRVAAEFWAPVLSELATRRDNAPALRERVERLVRRAA